MGSAHAAFAMSEGVHAPYMHDMRMHGCVNATQIYMRTSDSRRDTQPLLWLPWRVAWAPCHADEPVPDLCSCKGVCEEDADGAGAAAAADGGAPGECAATPTAAATARSRAKPAARPAVHAGRGKCACASGGASGMCGLRHFCLGVRCEGRLAHACRALEPMHRAC